MSEVDPGEERLLGKRDVEEDPRFNTLFSRLELKDRWHVIYVSVKH